LKDISNRTVAVIDTIDHRFGKIHEPPHQIQRHVGAGLSDPVDDHPPLQVEVFYDVPSPLPVDEGPCFSKSGDAFADLGSDAVAADLRGQFQTEASFDVGIGLREVDKDCGEPLGAERRQIVQGDRLRRHAGQRAGWHFLARSKAWVGAGLYCAPRAAPEKELVRLRQAAFAGPEAVLAYLARYTHRVAIANSRLHSVAGRRGPLSECGPHLGTQLNRIMP
jgi:hypothetical protein